MVRDDPEAGALGRLRRRAGRWAPALLLSGVALLYLAGLGLAGLYDLDESVYAEISREMLAQGNWLTPHLDYLPYLEKPPLLFWLDALSFKAWGVSEFAARLPTGLAAIAGVGMVYAMGRNLWSRRAGLVAAAALGTSFGYFIFGRMVLPDMLFSVLVIATFWGFSRALLTETASRGAVLGAYAAMAGAVLAKGLIGLVFPMLAVGAFILLTQDWRLIRRLEIVWGGLLFLLIAAPWHLLMVGKHPGFLRFFFGDELFSRFLGRRPLQNYVSLPISTYLLITLVWFCPWSIFLPAAVGRCWPRTRPADRAERGSLFVLLWAAVVVGFFAASAVRLEYYTLPALPAFSLCIGRFFDAELESPVRSVSLNASWIALLAFAACLAPASYFFPRLAHTQFYNLFPDAARSPASAPVAARVYDVPGFSSLVRLLGAVGALVAAGSAAAAWIWFRRRPRSALVCLAGTMALGLAQIDGGFVLFAPYRSVAQLADILRDELRPGDQILIEGRYERHAGIGFYTGQRIRVYRGREGVLWYDSHGADTQGTFVTDAEFARLWRGPERVYLLSDVPDSLSRMRSLAPATVVLGRTGNDWLFANRARDISARSSSPPRI